MEQLFAERHLMTLLGVLLLVIDAVSSAAVHVCPDDMFYDLVTRNCASCIDICYNSLMQRTEALCSDKCPGFLKSSISLAVSTMQTDAPTPGPDSNKNTVIFLVICVSIVVGCGILVAAVCYKVDNVRQKIVSIFRGRFCIQWNQKEEELEYVESVTEVQHPVYDDGVIKYAIKGKKDVLIQSRQ